MTDNAKIILNEMKKVYPTEMTKQQLAARLSEFGITVPHITGTVNALLKKGYATERQDEVPVEGDDKKTKVLRYVVLNDAGLAYDPDEEAAQKAAEKAAAREARELEKAAAKAAKK